MKASKLSFGADLWRVRSSGRFQEAHLTAALFSLCENLCNILPSNPCNAKQVKFPMSRYLMHSYSISIGGGGKSISTAAVQ